MSKEEIIGIVIFSIFFFLGLFVPSTGGRLLPLLIFGGGFGLTFGLPLFLYGYSRRKTDTERTAYIQATPAVTIKSLSMGSYKTGYVSGNPYQEWVSAPDSANGWSLRIQWIHGYDKTVKYVHFNIVFVNAVGDVVYDNTHRRSEVRATVTGPIYKGSKQSNVWERILYYPQNVTPRIRSVLVEFMDGTTTNQYPRNPGLPW